MKGVTLQAGVASGELLKLTSPLSFWGGTDINTGRVVDAHHPQYGAELSGRIVAIAASRGSSSSSSVLAEQIRLGLGPSALLVRVPDAILTLGAMVAAELYACHTPVVLLRPEDFDRLPHTAIHAQVTADAELATVTLTTST